MNHIARFTVNGLLDNTFVADTGANKPIYAMQRQWPNDKIFIGGLFTSYNGSVRNYVARLNPDSSVDTTFDSWTKANGPVYAFDWNDYIRRVRIVGGFTSYQGVSRPGIAQIFASGGSFTPALFLLIMD